jgi:hypothetical protein
MKTPKTLVRHCKDGRKYRSTGVYIGRPSKWGNPFKIGRDGTREEVLAKYEAYIRARPDLMECLEELRYAVLLCWCYPERCHGDILVKLLEERDVCGKVESTSGNK